MDWIAKLKQKVHDFLTGVNNPDTIRTQQITQDLKKAGVDDKMIARMRGKKTPPKLMNQEGQ
jgi:hypothetical protein